MFPIIIFAVVMLHLVAGFAFIVIKLAPHKKKPALNSDSQK